MLLQGKHGVEILCFINNFKFYDISPSLPEASLEKESGLNKIQGHLPNIHGRSLISLRITTKLSQQKQKKLRVLKIVSFLSGIKAERKFNYHNHRDLILFTINNN